TAPLKPKKTSKEKEDEVDDPSLHPLKIFFASQTGTAEDFARKLAIESKRYKFKAKVVDLEDYDPVSAIRIELYNYQNSNSETPSLLIIFFSIGRFGQ